MFLCQSGIWPTLAKLLDMDFKFVLPRIYIDFDIQTNFEVNQTQISHSIPKNTPEKWPYLKTPFSPANFGFWAQNFFGGLNQKSA